MQNVQVQDFGGLDLSDDPPEVNGAIDMLNVDLGQRGRVRSRDGYTHHTSAAAAGRYDYLLGWTNLSSWYLVASRGTTLEALRTNGTSATTFAQSASSTGMATYGDPANLRVFIGNGTDPLIAFNPAVPNFFSPVYTGASPTGKYVAVTPNDNRLVCANVAANSSRVMFSNPGDANTWGANNYVDLHPGDGETIQGIIVWRELLLVFKETKFFVFYSTTIDGTGNPSFNYREVAGGRGLTAPMALAAGPDGVYFLHRTGVYLTDGGSLRRISSALDPLFQNALGSDFQSSAVNQTSLAVAAAAFYDKRLYVAVPTGVSTTNDRMLVFDPDAGWLLWDIKAGALTTWRLAAGTALMFTYPTGANHVGIFSSVQGTYTTDDGTAIASRYQSGWTDLGTPNDKRIREIAAWGSGTPTLSLFKDRGSTDTLAAAVTLGTAPAVTRGVQRKARTGRELSWKVSASSGAWNVSSLELLIADQRGN